MGDNDLTISNPAPGYVKHPDHTVQISMPGHPVTIMIGDEIIATINDALILSEKGYSDAYYLPKSALPAEMLKTSDHTTHCPFKGDASYYHLMYNGQVHENAVWSYKTPFDEALDIKEHISIYPNVAKVGPSA